MRVGAIVFLSLFGLGCTANYQNNAVLPQAITYHQSSVNESMNVIPTELEGSEKNDAEYKDDEAEDDLPEAVGADGNNDAGLGWFFPASSETWFTQIKEKADTAYLEKYFNSIGYDIPENAYILIAPIRKQDGKIAIRYFSYKNTAFDYSVDCTGKERFWPASAVKLMAAVLALYKLKEFHVSGKSIVNFYDIEGEYHDTVERLCREAMIPSRNTAYNRLMEIAGFDEINNRFLPEVFHFPTMILQRRYARHNDDENLRFSPEIQFTDGGKSGVIPERKSHGKVKDVCPNEGNCTTLAELAETMFRVVLHDELPENRRFPIDDADIQMLKEILRKTPTCIKKGASSVMGKVTIYNKGGKVRGNDRVEVAVVESSDGNERYLIALSLRDYEGVEKETNLLAGKLIEAMRGYCSVDK